MTSIPRILPIPPRPLAVCQAGQTYPGEGYDGRHRSGQGSTSRNDLHHLPRPAAGRYPGTRLRRGHPCRAHRAHRPGRDRLGHLVGIHAVPDPAAVPGVRSQPFRRLHRGAAPGQPRDAPGGRRAGLASLGRGGPGGPPGQRLQGAQGAGADDPHADPGEQPGAPAGQRRGQLRGDVQGDFRRPPGDPGAVLHRPRRRPRPAPPATAAGTCGQRRRGVLPL
ncbi:hypothetical protein PAERUG_E6_London_17_VIM_2_12_12_00852 [Pseudomonas aeruginosa]|nr:hypothetical protein PAERUG_E2_London_17_VIM_2_02_09_01591 [Pseudomonas aeruginosa]CRO95123.1 hypothetical protein PAERUG_E6_London_17_VIM_2_12_12_00852 [Pseudomonas aeruginosa]CRQ56483.1 hypothetical protein PAERUG_P49_London_7_VIM_2_01_13_01728 [Pseudomonas aeruginosa]CRQ73230.1 hypothetical protein PAERUG_P47_London_12_VIM_2_12_12_02484 [Pseudomonas aeruginosa]CRQ92926.1 hypothetical protein PAERUG_E5_London_17_VIM_2_12_12_05392 [Pseudomonas aeruginosa]